jgi:hypothetical protein
MTSRDFTITTEDYNNKKKTIIQHKVRTLLKCYTVQDFNLDEQTKSFTFKKTYRVNGVHIVSDRVLEGKYDTESIGLKDGKEYLKLVLSV